jgi:hypothetical protein
VPRKCHTSGYLLMSAMSDPLCQRLATPRLFVVSKTIKDNGSFRQIDDI